MTGLIAAIAFSSKSIHPTLPYTFVTPRLSEVVCLGSSVCGDIRVKFWQC